jgi:hypothetical protein
MHVNFLFGIPGSGDCGRKNAKRFSSARQDIQAMARL